MLIIERDKGKYENMWYFSSPPSQYTARMNIMEDVIVVEHDIPYAESGTFRPDQRNQAIKFIQCLFKVFS